MPSPIAHAVTGYCLGRLWPEMFLSENITRKKQRLLIGIGILSAVVADLDFLPQLVSDVSLHRGISHSLGIAALCSVMLALLLYRGSQRALFFAVGLGFIAYASHLLMDLLTTGGRGIPIFWPMTSHLVQLPVTIFPQVHHSEGLFYSGHIPVLVFETTFALLLFWLTQKIIYLHKKTERYRRMKQDELTNDVAFLKDDSKLSQS